MPKIVQNTGKAGRNLKSQLKVTPRNDRAKNDGFMDRGQETSVNPSKKDVRG